MDKQCNLVQGLEICEGACAECEAYEALPTLTYEEAVKRTERDKLYADMCRAGQASNHAPRKRVK